MPGRATSRNAADMLLSQVFIQFVINCTTFSVLILYKRFLSSNDNILIWELPPQLSDPVAISPATSSRSGPSDTVQQHNAVNSNRGNFSTTDTAEDEEEEEEDEEEDEEEEDEFSDMPETSESKEEDTAESEKTGSRSDLNIVSHTHFDLKNDWHPWEASTTNLCWRNENTYLVIIHYIYIIV